jgi:diguanylate cyclase (GGDEF)-like protein
MRLPTERDEATKRQMARSAAAIFGGGILLGFSQAMTPEGPESSLVPAFFALGFMVLLLVRGARLPTVVLGAFGPIGTVLIGVALATSPGPGDAAVLYMWPVLWVAYFFGRSGTILIVATVAVVQAGVLIALPPESSYVDRWFDVVVSVGIVAGVVNALSSRNARLLERFAAEARIDQLTGLLNRRGFEERVPSELARAAREQTSVAVVSFDIDHFKRVNDDWGHEEGDRVLVRLAKVFRRETRESDVVVRMGGEEFVALLWASDLDEASNYAERVRASFAGGTDEDRPRPTVSAGVTAARAPVDIDRLLRDADDALYAAKCTGRNRTVVHPAASNVLRPGPLAAELVESSATSPA